MTPQKARLHHNIVDYRKGDEMPEKKDEVLQQIGTLLSKAGYKSVGLHFIKFSCFADECGPNCSNGCNAGCSSCSQGCTSCSTGKSNGKVGRFHFQPTFQLQQFDIIDDIVTIAEARPPAAKK
jgi:hypothetical protein